MARSEDPIKDLERCAEIAKEVSVLLNRGCDPYEVSHITEGLADRIKDNVSKLVVNGA